MLGGDDAVKALKALIKEPVAMPVNFVGLPAFAVAGPVIQEPAAHV